MKIGIIRFPGTTCEVDTFNWFANGGHEPFYIFHKETNFPKELDLLVLPGGFAFGDRVYKEATGKYVKSPGEQALKSPVMEGIIFPAADKGIMILGICNGFQILTHAGLLPGKLVRNDSDKYYCGNTDCRLSGASFFGDEDLYSMVLNIPVSHGYGKYIIDPPQTTRMLGARGQVFLRYWRKNPNGSMEDIAGVCNHEGNIWGMMPHPERSPDGDLLLKAIEKSI